MPSSGRTLNSAPVGRANCPGQATGVQTTMRAKIALLLSVSLLTGATAAAVAQPLPCASVAPEVRERVREAGACRDDTPWRGSTEGRLHAIRHRHDEAVGRNRGEDSA